MVDKEVSTSRPPFMAVYMREVGIVLGVDGVSRVRFPLSTFMHYVGRVIVTLGASYTSLQLVVVSLQLSEFLLMASLHLCNVFGVVGECRCLRANRVLTIGEKRPQGKFYHSLTVAPSVLIKIWS